MKWLVLVLLLAYPPPKAKPPESDFAKLQDPLFQQNIIEFDVRFDKFLRTYLGCSSSALYVQQCKPTQGGIDLKAYKASLDAVTKIFPVERVK